MHDSESATATRPRGATTAALWGLALVCLAGLTACAGGSGSSGFDARALEDQSIARALDTGMCQVREGLTICGAEAGLSTPGRTPTQPTPTPTRRTPTPRTPPAATPTALTMETASPTTSPFTVPSPTPTPTALPAAPGVETDLDGNTTVECLPLMDELGCGFDLQFAAQGIAPEAVYRVALRTADPPGDWRILPAPTTSGSADAPRFDQSVVLFGSIDVQATYQLAVLAFLSPPSRLPDSVHRLAESGADFAFVTRALRLTDP